MFHDSQLMFEQYHEIINMALGTINQSIESVHEKSRYLQGPAQISFMMNERPSSDRTMYEGFGHYEKAIGAAAVFRKKSIITQALLVPRPELRQLIGQLWSQLKTLDGRYIAVHIRRGDKLVEEAPTFPVSLYCNYFSLKMIDSFFRSFD